MKRAGGLNNVTYPVGISFVNIHGPKNVTAIAIPTSVGARPQCVLAIAAAKVAFVAVAPGSSLPAVVLSKEKSCRSGLPPRFAEKRNFFD